MKTLCGLATIALLMCGIVGVPAVAQGGEATDQIRGTIDRGIAILMRPDLQGDAKKQERRALLRQELYPRFDFEEISRRALGVNWKGRTPEEKQEFIKVFKELLENSYASKIEGYKGEKIVFGQEALDLPYAEVRTKVVTTKGEQFDVNYRVLKNGDEWRIYDIVIEGVSLVNNYRSQFTDMLSKYSFSEMMERLKKTAEAVSAGGK
ncbi:MAG: ABC transporter substrate-binding protein [Syntrophorhabdaceae bacterium]|nr:ABC transporter substrate-binding protein [Syntrophorhabdaceae bacterium]